MISTDLPITKSDDDILNRSSFAQNLAKVIIQYSCQSSFSIGLYGEWGSGKTSLLNMVLEAVEKSDTDAVILRFNPWLCSDPKQLISQFFKQMSTAMKLKKSVSSQICEVIDEYADFFDIASIIPIVGPFVAAAGKTANKKAKKNINKRENDLQKTKNQIIEKLIKEKLKIIIAIDDIDRLSEEEIIAVFQVVKALADFPDTIYILAFDYEVVVRALGKVQHGKGREYLEKVVQVPFEIPAPDITSIYDAFIVKLNIILKNITEDNWNKAVWGELFHFGIKEYIHSIRDVVRYTNVFSLKFELLKDETDIIDLLGLTCLQVFEPFIYSKLPSFKETLCGTNERGAYELQKAEEEKVRKMITILIEEDMTVNIEAAKKIIGILFPRTKEVTNVLFSMGRYYTYRDFLINKNIAYADCFDRYFSLSLEKNAIPSTVMKHLIFEADETDFIEGIELIYKEGKIIRLLQEIEAYANKDEFTDIPAERAEVIIRSIIRCWHSFHVDDSDFFSVPFAWRLISCIEGLLKSIDMQQRSQFMCGIFEDTQVRLTTLALLLNNFERQHGRYTEKTPDENRQRLSLDGVLELEKIFKKRAVEELNSGIALKLHNGLGFMWMLEKLDAEFVADKKKTLITDDISLAQVISYCTSYGTAAGRIITKTWRVDQKSVGEYIDIDEAYNRICLFVKTKEFSVLLEDEKLDIAAFILDYEKDQAMDETESYANEDAVRKKLHELVGC